MDAHWFFMHVIHACRHSQSYIDNKQNATHIYFNAVLNWTGKLLVLEAKWALELYVLSKKWSGLFV